MIFGTVTENVGQQMENTEDIQVILADRQEVLRILREERVSMRCGLMLMQFLKAETEAPFAFLNTLSWILFGKFEKMILQKRFFKNKH